MRGGVGAMARERLACSMASRVRGCSHRCRSCTLACHVSLAAALLQLSQLRVLTTNSTTSERCNSVPDSTSAATVSLTLSRRECGSVQIQLASTRRMPLRPLTRRTHSASSSGDSGCSRTHCGFLYHTPQVRHISTSRLRSIFSVKSVVALRQLTHRPSTVASTGTERPQRQQAIVGAVCLGRGTVASGGGAGMADICVVGSAPARGGGADPGADIS